MRRLTTTDWVYLFLLIILTAAGSVFGAFFVLTFYGKTWYLTTFLAGMVTSVWLTLKTCGHLQRP